MFTRHLRAAFSFTLVWVVYRAPDYFIEGFHDRAVRVDFMEPDAKYLIDLISPIYILPEAVALSIGVFVWRNTSKKDDFFQLLCYFFGILLMLSLFLAAGMTYVFYMTLDGHRPYNSLNYLGSVFAIAIGVLPWICQRLQNKKA